MMAKRRANVYDAGPPLTRHCAAGNVACPSTILRCTRGAREHSEKKGQDSSRMSLTIIAWWDSGGRPHGQGGGGGRHPQKPGDVHPMAI